MGIITLARYLARRDPALADFLQASLAHAQASDLAEADLAVLRLLIKASAC